MRSAGGSGASCPCSRRCRVAVIGSLVCAFVAMLGQVAVPRVTMAAIDAIDADRPGGLMPYVWILLVLAVIRGVLTYT